MSRRPFPRTGLCGRRNSRRLSIQALEPRRMMYAAPLLDNGELRLHHAWPSNYVVPLCIPEGLRTSLREKKGELERLDCELQRIVIDAVRLSGSSNVDWLMVQEQIASALSQFGSAIATADESFLYWIDHRIPGIRAGNDGSWSVSGGPQRRCVTNQQARCMKV